MIGVPEPVWGSSEARYKVPILRLNLVSHVTNVVPAVRAALERLRAHGNAFVCVSKRTDRWFEDCVTAAGVADFHWHDLRHTFASRLIMAGVDLRTTQDLLGHKTIAMTLRYSHLALAHRLEAVSRLVARPPTGTPPGTASSGPQLVREEVA